MSLLFEAVTCSRCGGSGHFSYCQRYGTTCFKCGGQKQVLTKRGRIAQALYTRLLSKPLYALQPGDQIREYGLTMGGDSFVAWYQVERIRKDELNPGWVVEMARVARDGKITDERTSFGGLNLGHVFRVRLQDKARLANIQMIALAYQSVLSQCGKEPKWYRTVAWG